MIETKRIISIFCIVFCVAVNVNVTWAASEIVDRVVAVVNDDIILLSELNKELTPYLNNIASAGYATEKKEAIIFKLKQDLINRMIERTLTDQEVKRLNLSVSDEEVDAAIDRLKKSQFLTQESLEKALSQDGLTYKEYREKMRHELLRPRLINTSVKSKVIVTDEDIKNYYDKHPSEFGGEKTYHLYNILIKNSAQGGEAGTGSAMAVIKDIKARLDKGEDFKDLARQFSQAPNASDAGDLGVFKPQAVSKQISEALSNLEQGQYTDILDTDQGYQIFYIQELNLTEQQALDKVSDQISQKLYNDIVETKFRSWIESLQGKAHIKKML
ncbi:MAG: SurA N-terminal domain-containing protein [Pseudomonadota bacterium]